MERLRARATPVANPIPPNAFWRKEWITKEWGRYPLPETMTYPHSTDWLASFWWKEEWDRKEYEEVSVEQSWIETEKEDHTHQIHIYIINLPEYPLWIRPFEWHQQPYREWNWLKRYIDGMDLFKYTDSPSSTLFRSISPSWLSTFTATSTPPAISWTTVHIISMK